MCVYCMVPDFIHRWFPAPGVTPYAPSPIDPYPYTNPSTPIEIPWTRDMLTELEELIEQIRDILDRAECKVDER